MNEAIRWLSKPEVPTVDDLATIIINTILATEAFLRSPSGDEVRPLVMGLMSAYDGARQLAEAEVYWLDSRQAEDIMRAAFVGEYQRAFPEVDGLHVVSAWMWPDALDYRGRSSWDRRLVHQIGVALGYLEVKRVREMLARKEAV